MKKIPLIVAALAAARSSPPSRPARSPAADEPVEIVFWHAQTDSAQKAIHTLVGKFNKTHPGIVVRDQLGSNGDSMVQKLQAVIGSDNYPDIAYVYGSDVPNVAQSNKVVDITKDIKASEASTGTACSRRAARRPPSTARSSASRPSSTTSPSSTTRSSSRRPASRRPRPTGRGTTTARSPRSSRTRARTSTAPASRSRAARTPCGGSGR